MARLIPEKTVELWTAFALLDYLGQDTWIWARTSHADQDVWTPDLQKFFMLELKAPEASSDPYFTIDRIQLDRYVSGYANAVHPDVIYVLPVPWWSKAPRLNPIPPVSADPRIRRCFADWSYVIRATDLQQLVGPHSTTGKASCRVRCSGHSRHSGVNVYYHDDKLGRKTRKYAAPLSRFLLQMRLCTEPVGTAMRGRGLNFRERTVPAPIRFHDGEHRDLRLNYDSMFSAINALQLVEPQEQDSPSYLLYVGLP